MYGRKKGFIMDEKYFPYHSDKFIEEYPNEIMSYLYFIYCKYGLDFMWFNINII